MDLKECYSIAGANYDDVLRRFMSEERVDRFLKMFLNDQSFELLCTAMEAHDYEEAFRAVHTMKGICMNLSLNSLLDSCIALTENLRSGNTDEHTDICFTDVKEAYQRTAGAIRCHLE